MSTAAAAPNGASAASASATSVRSRALAPVGTENADDRRLAGLRILAGLLADQRRIALDVEQIVGDLERLADRRAIAIERRRAAPRSPVRGCRRRGRRT